MTKNYVIWFGGVHFLGARQQNTFIPVLAYSKQTFRIPNSKKKKIRRSLLSPHTFTFTPSIAAICAAAVALVVAIWAGASLQHGRLRHWLRVVVATGILLRSGRTVAVGFPPRAGNRSGHRWKAAVALFCTFEMFSQLFMSQIIRDTAMNHRYHEWTCSQKHTHTHTKTQGVRILKDAVAAIGKSIVIERVMSQQADKWQQPPPPPPVGIGLCCCCCAICSRFFPVVQHCLHTAHAMLPVFTLYCV